MAGSRDYTVRICHKESVVAALPLQGHWLPFSNLDLLFPPLDVSIIFCYTKPSPLSAASTGSGKVAFPADFASQVTILKASLAKALVTFYPLAGEVVANSVGEPELLCSNRGVDFIEAYADVKLAEIDFHDGDKSVEQKLVPKKKEGVLTVQATKMKCGGMVIGCTFDHRISDANSFNMFIVAWAETAVMKPISTLPTFRRSLLSPRRQAQPVSLEASPDRFFVPVSQLPPSDTATPTSDSISRFYYICADSISRLQAMATAGGRRSTKLEAFTAYLWKHIGLAGCKAAAPICHMGVMVDGRHPLGPAMDGYFGNVVSMPYGSLGVDEVAAMGLGEVVEVVHGLITEAAREEHFKALLDWVDARRPEPAVLRLSIEKGLSVVVSSGREFPLGKVNFGWGKAAFGAYYFPAHGSVGYVMPMPSPKENGDWVVYAHLSRGLMEVLDSDGASVFQPLTSYYLMNNRV